MNWLVLFLFRCCLFPLQRCVELKKNETKTRLPPLENAALLRWPRQRNRRLRCRNNRRQRRPSVGWFQLKRFASLVKSAGQWPINGRPSNKSWQFHNDRSIEPFPMAATGVLFLLASLFIWWPVDHSDDWQATDLNITVASLFIGSWFDYYHECVDDVTLIWRNQLVDPSALVTRIAISCNDRYHFK